MGRPSPAGCSRLPHFHSKPSSPFPPHLRLLRFRHSSTVVCHLPPRPRWDSFNHRISETRWGCTSNHLPASSPPPAAASVPRKREKYGNSIQSWTSIRRSEMRSRGRSGPMKRHRCSSRDVRLYVFISSILPTLCLTEINTARGKQLEDDCAGP